ncbi:MAG: hypothetical protein M3468_16810 [Acidobacteriota bacterium]|nr:hypothetical protein [Acidobacteriota bacterium]
MTRRPVFQILMSAALLAPLAGCEVKKSDNPLSPSVAGPIAGVQITAPRVLEPGEGIKLKEAQQPITLLVENSSSNGVRPVAYTFEVSSTENFEQKLYARSGVTPGTDGRTRVTVDRLDSGRRYFWRSRAEDGANSSLYTTSTFEVLPRPQLDPPGQRSPIENAQIGTRRPELLINASARNVSIGNVVYEFQISTGVAFSGIVAAGERSEAGPSTSYSPDSDLAAGATYYWRTRATDRETTSAWSNTQAFRTAAAPAPGPGPGPAPPSGGPCNFSNPTAIVQCERAKYGHMSHSQMYDLMVAIVQSLNRNGIGGGPFGILRKQSGTNCNGYSCDIICAGQGGGQRQWDVLGDIDGAQSPGFSGPLPTIRPDVCEIR